MFRRARRRTLQWRRVAQFEPLRVEGAPIAQEDAAERPSGGAAIEAGMRVALARVRDDERDATAVAVESLDERRLGYLPSEVAAWVAPLLESGRVAFDGRIHAVEPADPRSNPGTVSFYLALTQFELRPVERFSLALALRTLFRLPVMGVNWCFGRAAVFDHAVSRTPLRPPRFEIRPSDGYAADDSSGG
jgi:HIRAN domain